MDFPEWMLSHAMGENIKKTENVGLAEISGRYSMP
jgi:hypothetical protein